MELEFLGPRPPPVALVFPVPLTVADGKRDGTRMRRGQAHCLPVTGHGDAESLLGRGSLKPILLG